MQPNDKQFKQIADIYTERYGGELRAEMDRLEQETVGVTVPEARLEQRVKTQIAAIDISRPKQNRPRYVNVISILAACFAIMFLVLVPYLSSVRNEDASYSGMAPAASEEVVQDSASTNTVSDADRGPVDTQAEQSASGYEILPLSTPLPQGFTQVGFEQDFGKSIYYVEDYMQDDVVITLEIPDVYLDTTELTPVNLNGVTAYAAQADAFNLLYFTVDEIEYVLTCRYDINTLIRLGSQLI